MIITITLFCVNAKIGYNNLLVLAQQEDHHQHVQQRVEHSKVNANSDNNLDVNVRSNVVCINKIDKNNNHQEEFKN